MRFARRGKFHCPPAQRTQTLTTLITSVIGFAAVSPPGSDGAPTTCKIIDLIRAALMSDWQLQSSHNHNLPQQQLYPATAEQLPISVTIVHTHLCLGIVIGSQHGDILGVCLCACYLAPIAAITALFTGHDFLVIWNGSNSTARGLIVPIVLEVVD